MANAEDKFQQGTPDWWLARLTRRLDARIPELRRYERYYDGKHPLEFASEKFRKAFGGLFDSFASNFMPLIVDAVEERLNVEGFRFGEDKAGDKDAWRIWQQNHLDADSQIAHTEALIKGEAAALVWPGDDYPLITVEDPCEVIVENKPGSRWERAAALKKWQDDSGYVFATLYLPDYVYKFKSGHRVQTIYSSPGQYRWERRDVDDETWPLRNPLGVVPMVPLPNRPRLLKPGQSEIKDAIPLQDAINKEMADLLVASEYVAFRQKWATGFDIPRDPETNQPIEPFKVALDRLFIAESDKAKFGDFSETNLKQYVEIVENIVQQIATQTRTPPHYFYLVGQFPSGEALKSAEAGLVAKARRKMRYFGEGWEEVMRLAFIAADKGDQVKDATVETIWGDPESRTEGEHVDATMKKQSIGVPAEQLWEDLGYSPTQIARFKQMRADEPKPPAPPTLVVAGTPAEPPFAMNGGSTSGE